MSNRCLHHATFREFLETDPIKILGLLHDSYHGDALTTTNEAWKEEIISLQKTLLAWKDENAFRLKAELKH